MSEEIYKLNTYCNNCAFRGEVEIPKGKKVEEAQCPNCGNTTLEKDDPVQSMSYID